MGVIRRWLLLAKPDLMGHVAQSFLALFGCSVHLLVCLWSDFLEPFVGLLG